jgi:hypothetical protein
MTVYGMRAARWSEDIEETIITAVDRLVQRIGADKKPVSIRKVP